MKISKKISHFFTFIKHNKVRKNYAILNPKDIDYFQSFLPKQSVVTDPHEIEPHNLCFRKHTQGQSQLMLCPVDTQQVSKILKYCN